MWRNDNFESWCDVEGYSHEGSFMLFLTIIILTKFKEMVHV